MNTHLSIKMVEFYEKGEIGEDVEKLAAILDIKPTDRAHDIGEIIAINREYYGRTARIIEED